MLAAILLNLPDYQRRGRSGGIIYDEPESRGKRISEAVSQINALAASPKLLGLKKKVRKVASQVKAYQDAPTVGIRDVADTHAALQALEYELRQTAEKQQQDQERNRVILMVLDQITVMLHFLQEDEEAVLVLLLSEP